MIGTLMVAGVVSALLVPIERTLWPAFISYAFALALLGLGNVRVSCLLIYRFFGFALTAATALAVVLYLTTTGGTPTRILLSAFMGAMACGALQWATRFGSHIDFWR